MGIGELIDRIIMTNIKIWHEDTKLRNKVDISDADQAISCAKGRVLNAKRSFIKYLINKECNDLDYDDRKINYTGGEK
jgi:hypothetical protein